MSTETASREPIIFKQHFTSRRHPNVRVLNQKHLIYIATRPGVIKNPGCAFGLWGKLPGMTRVQNINDARKALQAVGEASEDHTLYRVVLSADKETALQYGLHERDAWQRLVYSNISVIQREMGVKPENFCYAASMHYKRNHPHVHILWWDNGSEPRAEVMNKERFELASERIRKTFSNALVHGPELRAAQAGQAEADRTARLQLAAMFRDANIADALDLDRIRPAELDALGQGLAELARTLPPTGRLKYKFLKPDYKDRLNAWLKQVMELPQFAKLEQKYLSLSREVTQLYGNDDALSEKFLEQAEARFYADLGNETLLYLKTVAAELRVEEPPEDMARLRMETWHTADLILHRDASFEKLLQMLPRWETPTVELLKDPAIKKTVDQLTQRLAEDIRIRSKTALFLKMKEHPEKEDFSAAYRAMYQAVRAAVLNEIGRTAGGPQAIAYFSDDVPTSSEELRDLTRRAAEQLLDESADFRQFMDSLPKIGFLSDSPLRKERYRAQMEQIIQTLAGDLRLRTPIERYAAQKTEPQDFQTARSEEYKALYRSMRELVLETVEAEKGYHVQEQQNMAMMTLLRLFRLGSQSTNQLRSQRDLQRAKYRTLSEAAKRDLRKRRQQEGSWSAEL